MGLHLHLCFYKMPFIVYSPIHDVLFTSYHHSEGKNRRENYGALFTCLLTCHNGMSQSMVVEKTYLL